MTNHHKPGLECFSLGVSSSRLLILFLKDLFLFTFSQANCQLLKKWFKGPFQSFFFGSQQMTNHQKPGIGCLFFRCFQLSISHTFSKESQSCLCGMWTWVCGVIHLFHIARGRRPFGPPPSGFLCHLPQAKRFRQLFNRSYSKHRNHLPKSRQQRKRRSCDAWRGFSFFAKVIHSQGYPSSFSNWLVHEDLFQALSTEYKQKRLDASQKWSLKDKKGQRKGSKLGKKNIFCSRLCCGKTFASTDLLLQKTFKHKRFREDLIATWPIRYSRSIQNTDQGSIPISCVLCCLHPRKCPEVKTWQTDSSKSSLSRIFSSSESRTRNKWACE